MRLRGAPEQLTSFVGREREIAALHDRLRATRLLTITGAGGSGKTRLALELARREAAESAVDAAWVGLAALEDPARLGDTVLTALGARDESGEGPVDRVAAAIGERSFLLVLDNAEHLLGACASLVHGLLASLPLLRVLITSRSALGVGGETAWLVPPLSVGEPPEAGGEPEAVQLFVQRGQAASPGFRLTSTNRAAVLHICERLDGLPLALELAASRLRALSTEQIAARLDDRFRLLTRGNRAALPRQQTLRATVDWSYDALGADERRLFNRLAVFRGSFTIDAVESVGAGPSIAADDVLDLLASLVDKSLVEVTEHAGQARYRLLETMRQYAEARLAEAGELEERTRVHARYYAALTADLEPMLRTPERAAVMARLVPDVENLRHAVASSRHGDVPTHLRLVRLLHWFWFGTGQWPEAQELLQSALELPEAREPTLPRAALLFSAGAIAALQARGGAARAQLSEAEEIVEREDAPALLANIRNYLAMALNQEGDPAAVDVVLRARPWMQEANDLYALRLNFLLHGQALALRGDLPGAVAMTEEGVRVARVFGLRRELGIALQQLAAIVARTGDWPRAIALLREALEALRDDPMPLFIARAMELMASAATVAGAPGDAALLSGVAEGIRESIGAAMWQLDVEQHGPHMRAARRALGAAGYDAAVAEGRSLGAVEGIARALAVAEGLGGATELDPTRETGEYRVAFAARDERPDGVPSLGVRALGPLEITVDGAPVSQRDWTYSKARELLLYLLVHPDGRTREQVGLALWPEASSAQLRNNFHVALHHLRRALGHAEWVRYEGSRYRLDIPGRVAFDARSFEKEVTAALQAARRGPFPLEALSRALDRYHGDFLDGEPAGDWHFTLRDRLARLLRDGLESLGTALVDGDRAAEAIDVLERLVEREPLHERGYRALMLARLKAGDRDGALAAYRRVEKALRQEGITAPARETVELLHRLQAPSP